MPLGYRIIIAYLIKKIHMRRTKARNRPPNPACLIAKPRVVRAGRGFAPMIAAVVVMQAKRASRMCIGYKRSAGRQMPIIKSINIKAFIHISV